MLRRLHLSDVRALLLWAVLTAFMSALLFLLIVHLNLEPPESTGQMASSVVAYFVYAIVYCSVVALALGLPLAVLTPIRMRAGWYAGVVCGAFLGLASAAVSMVLFSFNGSTSSSIEYSLLGVACGALAGVAAGRKASEPT
jgi:hypothetical protein